MKLFALTAALFIVCGQAQARVHSDLPFDEWRGHDQRYAHQYNRSIKRYHRARHVAAYIKHERKAKRRGRARNDDRPRPRYYTPKRLDSRVAGVTPMPHPEGCPRRAFCGCGVSLYVFGERVRSLYLAANWLKYPRAEPGPGKVAARRGHVMAILRSYGDGTALVYDPNSGRHQTRIRRRSLAGFVVVNPHARSRSARIISRQNS